MKKETIKKRIQIIGLVTAIVLGSVAGATGGMAIKANAENAAEVAEDKETVENLATERIGSLLNNTTGEGKEETVYIFTDATGKQEKIIVNEKLNNNKKEINLLDKSSLADILNLSGDEKFTQNGDDLTWNAEGNSITYQGTTTKQAPIDIKVTYTLDGKEISAEDLAGKSGHVSIRFDYTNNEKQTIDVNGEECEAYVPFTVVTAMLLSNDHFSNVTVENGEASKLTTGTMVMGVALPGLKDSLNKSLENTEFDLSLEFPEYVVVEADTEKCEIDLILSVASSSLVNVDSFEDVSTNNIEEKLHELEDATEQLSDGATELEKGSRELLNGTGKVSDGAKQLYDGTSELSNGVGKLSSGVSELSSGAGQLKDGSSKLSGGASEVAGGANSLANGASSLAAGANQVSAGVDTLVSSVAAMPSQIQASEQALYNQANAALSGTGASVNYESDHSSMSTASIDAAISAVNGALSGATAQYQAALSRVMANGATTFDSSDAAAAVAAYMSAYGADQATAEATIEGMIALGTADIQSGLAGSEYFAQLNQLAAGYYNAALSQISGQSGAVDSLYQLKGAVSALQGVEQSLSSVDASQLAALKQGASDVANGAATLSDGATKLSTGASTLAAGASELDNGVGKLQGGIGQLSSGVSELSNGASKLNEGAKDLYNGTKELYDGADKLHDGMVEMQGGVSEFKSEGIDKISELAEEDATNLINRIKAVIRLGNDYKSFAGKPDDMEGSVVFIYRMPGIN